ncbi:MAG: DUF427 domain-containing protein [Azospirillaceae bacterium]
MAESVWSYPRPPRVGPTRRRLMIEAGGRTIADTTAAYRVLETSHPPTYYLPPGDVADDLLRPNRRRTMCEFKGKAAYFDLVLPDRTVEMACWCYPDPTPAFADIQDYLCFYPSKVDACFVDGERVAAQEGDFYGGWITSDIEGPFKGAPGTRGW